MNIFKKTRSLIGAGAVSLLAMTSVAQADDVTIALIPGIVNGWLVVTLGIPPFIGALGMYGVTRGAAFLFAGGMTVAVSNETMKFLGNGLIFGVPILAIIVVALCVVAHYILSQTKFGQHTYAMGANKAAADRAGINTTRLTIKI